MFHCMLRHRVVNRKHAYRLYRRRSELQRRRKKFACLQAPLVVPLGTTILGSMDFVSDQLSNGRRFRVLNVKDDYSKALVGQLVAYSTGGHQVVRFLNQLIEARSARAKSPVTTVPSLRVKRYSSGRTTPGSTWPSFSLERPIQNAFVESLNGRFRLECLNQHWFRDLEEVRVIIDPWRDHYHHERQHSTFNYMTPAAFFKRAE